MERSPFSSACESNTVVARLGRVAAVVNLGGGAVDSDAVGELRRIVIDHGKQAEVHSADSSEIEAAVRRAVASDPDLLLVLAGDGTARLVAQLCGPDGPPLVPLHGGTMNMLPRALYGDATWQDTLRACLQTGNLRPVSGGRILDHTFYVAAILGTPALWAPVREAIRHWDPKAALVRTQTALAHAFSRKLTVQCDSDHTFTAEALAVLCPMISSACTDDSAFEAAALSPNNYADALRLGVNMLLSDWRRDPAAESYRCRRAVARSYEAIPGILDGEPHMFQPSVKIELETVAFHALVPRVV
jgi:diacylglycerol kinase family enzyme